MKTILPALTLAAFVFGAAPTLANGQNAAPPNARTVIDSQIALGTDYPPIDTKAFLSAPVLPLKKGAVLPSKGIIGPVGMNQMWSLRAHAFAIAARTVQYPVIDLVRCSNFSATGSFVKAIASTTIVKVNLTAGQVLHSGAYRIEAGRPIKAGEAIPSIHVVFGNAYFILSIEPAPQWQKKDLKTEPQPAFIIAREPANSADRDIALEAWRKSNQSVQGGNLPGLP